jgi:hypothetical protein
MFFTKCERPSFTPIPNNKQNSSVLLVSTKNNTMRILEETVRAAYKCVDFVQPVTGEDKEIFKYEKRSAF